MLRGLLLTGREPRYLRREVSAQPEHAPVASYEPLWWPPAKIVGHHLAPFLASQVSAEEPTSASDPPAGAVSLEIELDRDTLEGLSSSRLRFDEADDGESVEELMSPDPVVVAPEDTLGEAAERLLERGTTAAAVAEYGRLIGILTAGDLVRASARRVHPSEGRVPLWWPPAKIVGLHLAPFLAAQVGTGEPTSAGDPPAGAVSLDVELDRETLEALRSSPLTFDEADDQDSRVDELMLADPVVVAPEDTLGEVAEQLLEHGTTAAAVAEYGQVIGILTVSDLVRASARRVHPSEGRVRQWMTAEPVTVAPKSSVAAAGRLAKAHGIRQVLVVDGMRPVGMLVLDETLREPAPIGLGL